MPNCRLFGRPFGASQSGCAVECSCRALLLVTKAKLEAVAAGVSIFEEEFLANIVLPDGSLVGHQARVALAAAYEGREMPPLLPDYSVRA